MAEINLSKYGITGTTEIVHNPSYEELFKEEMKPELKGYEKGQETELGAVNVIQDVLPKISSSLKTRTPTTLYGGLPMSTRTTTIVCLRKHGLL